MSVMTGLEASMMVAEGRHRHRHRLRHRRGARSNSTARRGSVTGMVSIRCKLILNLNVINIININRAVYSHMKV